jgi:N-acetylneuraminic acid mutarotase
MKCLSLFTTAILTLSLAVFAGPVGLHLHAQGGTWATKASMPNPRWQSAAGEINGVLYVAAGYNGGHLTPVSAYTVATDTWATKNPKPFSQTASASGVVGGILYAAGGTNCCVEVNTFTAYDPVTDTWTTKASMPTTRQGAAGVVINGLFYVVGGVNSGGPLSTLEVYDPVTNSWSTKASMPTARSHLAAAVVNDVLYAIGGFNSGVVLNTVEAYDSATNTWTSKAPMPTARWILSAAVVNDVLYAVGGLDATSSLATAEAYKPASNSWTTVTSMPTARAGLEAVAVDGVLYAIGGFTAGGTIGLGAVEAFTPSSIAVSGLEAPLASLVPEGDSVPLPDHAFKRGRTLPLKVQMSQDGTPLADADSAPRIVGLVRIGDPPLDLTTIDLDAGQANDSGMLFRFEDGSWVYNLSTKGLATGTYTLTVEMPDGQRYSAGFVLR